MRIYHLTLRVENNPGVLARVCLLFAQRGYNIISLSVAPEDESAKVSKIDLSVRANEAILRQIIAQSLKLVEVLQAGLKEEKIITKEDSLH